MRSDDSHEEEEENEFANDSNPPHLQLAQTRLSVEDGELIRRNVEENVVMRIPLDDVESIRHVRKFSSFPFAGLVISGGCAALARFVSESNTLSVILYLVAILMLAISITGLKSERILLKARGEEIEIDCDDPDDECSGFVLSIRSMCGSNREETQ